MVNVLTSVKSFPVVAIGCSAGGLEAVIELLNNLTPTTGMAYVLIQHLNPTHESMLPAILSRKTQMKVTQVENKMLMECDHFYIIPADMDMELTDGHFKLEPRQTKPAHMPIDKFFVSLAEIKGENAIGVVLSGGANDGTLGLKAIREADGLTIVQDESAKFQSMPKSAIAEGVVDLILSPVNIALELIKLGDYLTSSAVPDIPTTQTTQNDKQELKAIFDQLKNVTQVDFTHYKIASITRRITRRMLLLNIKTIKEFGKHIHDNKKELLLLYNDILINVTKFFRDKDTFKYLRNNLIPHIIQNKLPDEILRIWVPACATGQEVYSIAMILCEVMGTGIAKTSVQIFATDLSQKSIIKARSGIYSKSEVAEISPDRLQAFFEKVDGNYRINKMLRDICVFATHDILQDPPFSRIDLVSCCNLFIYLDADSQRKVIDTFHYALKSSGYLMLGKSESIGSSGKFFKQIDKEFKVNIYRRDISIRQSLQSYPSREMETSIDNAKDNISSIKPIELGQVVDNLLATKYVTPSVVIDQECEILQFRGATNTFLEAASGSASLNLLKMAKPGLRIDIRTAIHKCVKTGLPIRKDGLEVKVKNITYPVSIEVVPLNMIPDTRCLLVLFYEHPPQIKSDSSSLAGKKIIQLQLEQEIIALRADMTSIIEEREAVNEDLQNANEEIISSNEEMHTINEELQTSAEEMESSNEELNTINEQLQARNEQLSEVQEYTDGIIATIAETLIVVDRNLIVKSANESFYKIFKTDAENTEGFYLFDLGNGQWNIPKLRELLLEIIPQKGYFNGFEVNHEFPGIGNKNMLVNARLLTQRVQRTELIFIAILDNTEHIKAMKIINEKDEWFHNMANNAPVMIWVAAADKQRTFFNNTWLEFTGRSMEDEMGNRWLDNIHEEDKDHYVKQYNECFEKRIPFSIVYRVKRYDGVYRWLRLTCKPTYYDNKFTGFIGTGIDNTEQKMFAQELEQKVKERTEDLLFANNNLKWSNKELEQYAYVASHDLQEPLRKIQTFSDILQNKYRNDLPKVCMEYVDKIRTSSLRMTQLIEDLLNFSSVSNALDKHKPTDLNDIVKDVMQDFDFAGNNTVISFEHLPIIEAVPLQMKQLFHNLISNSIKFKKEKIQLNITISSQVFDPIELGRFPALDKTLPYLEIIFKDNGIGFSQEYAEQVFVIFKRLHGNQMYKGTGIGLALCRRILTNHHGEIYAESKEGEGTTFHMIFPNNELIPKQTQMAKEKASN